MLTGRKTEGLQKGEEERS